MTDVLEEVTGAADRDRVLARVVDDQACFVLC